MATEPLDLEGVPELEARSIREQVRYWQQYLANKEKQPPVELPRWKGKVIGRLTREDLYDDDE